MSPNGFALSTDDEGNRFSGFAWRAKGPIFYLMVQASLDRHDGRLGKLRSGKSCLAWKASKSLSIDELRTLCREMLAEAAGHL